MRVTVVVFPGSNCDHDVEHLYGRLLGAKVASVWHRDHDLLNPDLVLLPGGFAFGDYLRTGALAKISPIMGEVSRFAARGGPVVGICNGFQILCEAGLLPGVLLQNIDRRFLSRFVQIRVESTRSVLTRDLPAGRVVTCPIAHMEGNYFADRETLRRLEGEGQVVFRYCDAAGAVEPECRATNPNGALNAIAGIMNEAGNVVGLMPHPERASERLIGGLGGESGRCLFEATLR